jgi:uncharacterized membrane protein
MTATRKLNFIWIILLLWLAFHAIFFNTFIFHDTWHYNFPLIYRLISESSCGSITTWINGVDNGNPTILNLISHGITQIGTLIYVLVLSCIKPSITEAIYAFKLQIIFSFCTFLLGIYSLGLNLFQKKITTIYLLTIVMFSGILLNSTHSNQVLSIIFWLPWIAICFLNSNKTLNANVKISWIFLGTLLISAQTVDQYPHFIFITTICASLCIILVSPKYIENLMEIPSWKYFGCALILVITLFQLWNILNTAGDYQPSLRPELIVKPNSFGETAFLQETSILSIFFPLTTLYTYENIVEAIIPYSNKIFTGPRIFIFRLDSILVMTGIVPILFCLVLLLKKNKKRIECGLIIFTCLIAIIALQHSKLYYLLHQLPFFNLFRSYFLLTPIALLGLLVWSAYGFEEYVESNDCLRSSYTKKSISILLTLLSFCFLILVGLIYKSTFTSSQFREILTFHILDFVNIFISIWVFYKARRILDINSLCFTLLLCYSLTQILTQIGVLYLTGENIQSIIARYKLSSYSKEFSTEITHKIPCTTFASCYLSNIPTVSKNKDLEGTFLRNKNEPIYHHLMIGENLADRLSGLVEPIIWFNKTIEVAINKDEIIKKINSPNSQKLMNIILSTDPINIELQNKQLSNSKTRVINWYGSHLIFEHSSDAKGYIFAPINFNRHWNATIDNIPTEIYPANIGGLAIKTNEGINQKVALTYENKIDWLAILTRKIIVLLSLSSLIFIAVYSINTKVKKKFS